MGHLPQNIRKDFKDSGTLPYMSLCFGFVPNYVDSYMTQMLLSYNSRDLPFLKHLLEINLINKCSSGYIQNPNKHPNRASFMDISPIQDASLAVPAEVFF